MRSIWIARDKDGIAFVHFRKPSLQGDGVFRDGGQTMVCRVAPEEDLFPEIKPCQMVEYRARVNDFQKRQEIEGFNIVDFCLENYYNKTIAGGVALNQPFKDLHDRYGWKYADIHDKFKRELDARADVHITRTSDIFVKGAERKQLPIYNGQWYSHLYKRKD